MRTHWRSVVTAAMLAAVVAGCATSGAERTPTNSSLITRAEIESVTSASTLYDVVERLRPRWLQVRGERSLNMETGIVVYQGQARLGGVDVLRQFGPDAAVSLRFLDGPTAAATLPGLGSQHVEGAIVLETSYGRP